MGTKPCSIKLKMHQREKEIRVVERSNSNGKKQPTIQNVWRDLKNITNYKTATPCSVKKQKKTKNWLAI